MNDIPTYKRVLALQPMTRGVGYVVMEGPARVIDWGVKDARSADKNVQSLAQVSGLIQLYRPDVIIVEDYGGKASRRQPRVQELIDQIVKLAADQRMASCSVSRSAVRNAFARSGAFTKQQIAVAIAERLPQLAAHLPRPRRIWESEDRRMAIFDAASFALAFYQLNRNYRRAA